MAVLPAKSLVDTVLFTRLKAMEGDGQCSSGFSGNVLGICEEAAERLKAFPSIHGQFTLHDETHCLRVVQLIEPLAGSALEHLNPIEVALLILSAYLHDQGMVVDADERENLLRSDDWTLHEQNWISDHPNYHEIVVSLEDPLLDTRERERTSAALTDLHVAMFTDFIRTVHGERSAAHVRAKYSTDPRLYVNSRSIADLVALLCVSHVRPVNAITPGAGYRLDEFVGTTKVNLSFLAYVLRLADILDFDRDRTPESLYRAIHFTSPVSLLEWEKHRSVTGWEIGRDRIVFAAHCSHPAYQRAIYEFFDWIDAELSGAQTWSRTLPSEYERYRLNLPQVVDRSRVGPHVDPVSQQPLYRYFDLEFTLSRNEIVKLLMTDSLYTSKSLFVRELLQNGLDALRYRQALHRLAGAPAPDLRVQFEHFQESGFDVVRCRDNGVGMDESIVTRFLTKVGRSYYRSSEFERERERFKVSHCDFDPCAKFGIGFMSCFMFGDEITIHTRRDYGAGKAYGDPLVVEIKGLSGIVTIRPGPDLPVGTTVEVRGRRKSFTVDEWDDPVDLLAVLEGYALAAEFPIGGDCRIPPIKRRAEIVPEIRSRPAPIENIAAIRTLVFPIDVSTADPRLRGEIRVCTLSDLEGIPVVANEEAAIKVRREPGKNSRSTRVVAMADGSDIEFGSHRESAQVCCDGLLVAGEPGRIEREMRLGWYACNHGFGAAAFLIDARGDLKPNLTPARTPPNPALSREDATWQHLFHVASGAYTALLDQIVACCAKSGAPNRFWEIAQAYELDAYYLRLASAWSLPFPVAGPDGPVEWHLLQNLGYPELTLPVHKDEHHCATFQGNRKLQLTSELKELQGERGGITLYFLSSLLMGMSTLIAKSPTELQLLPRQPRTVESLADFVIREMSSWRWFFDFGGELARCLCVTGDHGFANAAHPVVIQGRAIERKPWRERSAFEQILGYLVWGNLGEDFDNEVPPNSYAARHRKRLGMLYRAVNWDGVDGSLQPPYPVFRPGVGVQELTEAHFERWQP